MRPRGPALVNGPPMETKRAAPIAGDRLAFCYPLHLVRTGHTARDGNQLDMSHTQTPKRWLVTARAPGESKTGIEMDGVGHSNLPMGIIRELNRDCLSRRDDHLIRRHVFTIVPLCSLKIFDFAHIASTRVEWNVGGDDDCGRVLRSLLYMYADRLDRMIARVNSIGWVSRLLCALRYGVKGLMGYPIEI